MEFKGALAPVATPSLVPRLAGSLGTRLATPAFLCPCTSTEETQALIGVIDLLTIYEP